jgi:hypothetical protein
MTSDQKSGLLLIAGAVLSVLTISIHPTGHDLTAGAAARNVAAHSIGILGLAVSFVGAVGLSRRLAGRDLALTFYGVALVAGMIAASLSGFTATRVTSEMAADPATAATWRLFLDYTGKLNRSFAGVLVGAASAAMIVWSLSMAKLRGGWRAAGVYGLALAVATLVGLFSGHLRLNLHGFGLVVLGQTLWFVAAGVLLLRTGQTEPSLPGR